jgi:cob(I)alamin adenosyltransferase
MSEGLIILYTGGGKGKTTAALGCVLRAAGRGLRSLVIQFMKVPGSSGEQMFPQGRIDEIDIFAFGDAFLLPGQDRAPHRERAEAAWRFMEGRLETRRYNILVLDELAVVLALGLLPTERVAAFLDRKEPSLHVIITGRDAPAMLIDRAHVVTEMREVKHPYGVGKPAVEGIDF